MEAIARAAISPKERRARARSRFFYALLRPILRLWTRQKFNFCGEELPDIGESYLLLSNHNTDYDMLFACVVSSRHMFFVASEHIMHMSRFSPLIGWAFAPIVRLKASLAASTVLSVSRTLRRGDNVCMFAEGNRSFDGRTCAILPSTGKLAKASGAALVTYRLEGGYFTSPRWSYTLRRGRVLGRVANVYSSEKLRGMSAEEISAAINADLFEDAYAREASEHIPFKGERLCLGLEHALYICPRCKKLGALHSDGEALRCECGLAVTFDEYGTLRGAPWDNIPSWLDWEKRELAALLDDPAGYCIADERVTLFSVDDRHVTTPLYLGRMELSGGALRFGERAFALENIGGVSVCQRQLMVLIYGGQHYEFNGEGHFCSLKYLHAYEHLTGRKMM